MVWAEHLHSSVLRIGLLNDGSQTFCCRQLPGKQFNNSHSIFFYPEIFNLINISLFFRQQIAWCTIWDLPNQVQGGRGSAQSRRRQKIENYYRTTGVAEPCAGYNSINYSINNIYQIIKSRSTSVLRRREIGKILIELMEQIVNKSNPSQNLH